MEKDYSNLHRMLVLKYFWQVIKRFKISFFSVVFFTIIASILDVYIPLKYLNLWNVLSANNFSFIYSAKLIIILILILNLVRWIFRRIGGFSASPHLEAAPLYPVQSCSSCLHPRRAACKIPLSQGPSPASFAL